MDTDLALRGEKYYKRAQNWAFPIILLPFLLLENYILKTTYIQLIQKSTAQEKSCIKMHLHNTDYMLHTGYRLWELFGGWWGYG